MKTTSYQTIHSGSLYSNSWIHRGVSSTTAGSRQLQLVSGRLGKAIINAFCGPEKSEHNKTRLCKWILAGQWIVSRRSLGAQRASPVARLSPMEPILIVQALFVRCL